MVDVEVSWPVIGVRQTAMDSGAGEVRLQDRVWLRSRLARTRGGDGVDDEDGGGMDADDEEDEEGMRVVGVGEEDLDEEGVEEVDDVLDEEGESRS